MSKILWGFKITPVADPVTGEPQIPETTAFSLDGKKSMFQGGAVRVAHPFKVNIVPRSPKHSEVLMKEYREALPILNRYD